MSDPKTVARRIIAQLPDPFTAHDVRRLSYGPTRHQLVLTALLDERLATRANSALYRKVPRQAEPARAVPRRLVKTHLVGATPGVTLCGETDSAALVVAHLPSCPECAARALALSL